MKKFLWLVLCSGLLLSACKSKKGRWSLSKKTLYDSSITLIPEVRKVVENSFGFDYLSFKSKCDYKDANMDQSFTMNLRMKYDSILWISITSIGFEALRIKMEKDTIWMVNRLEKKYYVYTYDYIQKLSGTPLNLSQVQKLLTANLIYPPQTYNITSEETKLKSRQEYVESTAILDSKSLVLEQFIQHLVQMSSANIIYSSFEKADDQMFPGKLDVSISSEGKSISLLMENSSVSTQAITSFPFEISDKYAKGN